jgi:hypothetical protein
MQTLEHDTLPFLRIRLIHAAEDRHPALWQNREDGCDGGGLTHTYGNTQAQR